MWDALLMLEFFDSSVQSIDLLDQLGYLVFVLHSNVGCESFVTGSYGILCWVMRNSDSLVFREVRIAIIRVQRWISLLGVIVEVSVLTLEASRVDLVMHRQILTAVPC